MRKKEKERETFTIVYFSSQKLVNILRKKTKMERKKVEYLSSFQWHISIN